MPATIGQAQRNENAAAIDAVIAQSFTSLKKPKQAGGSIVGHVPVAQVFLGGASPSSGTNQRPDESPAANLGAFFATKAQKREEAYRPLIADPVERRFGGGGGMSATTSKSTINRIIPAAAQEVATAMARRDAGMSAELPLTPRTCRSLRVWSRRRIRARPAWQPRCSAVRARLRASRI